MDLQIKYLGANEFTGGITWIQAPVSAFLPSEGYIKADYRTKCGRAYVTVTLQFLFLFLFFFSFFVLFVFLLCKHSKSFCQSVAFSCPGECHSVAILWIPI
jgi:hypothetical protein